MKSNMEIVNGFGMDEDAIYGLVQRIYSESDAFSSSFEEKYENRAAFSLYIKKLKMVKGAIFFVALKDVTPVGYVVIAPRPQKKLQHTSDLNMGVLASAGGKGIGHALLKQALHRIDHEQIIEIVYLMVLEDNLMAISLYQRHGFETVAILHRDVKYENQYFNGLMMRRMFP
jgi:ribosomal protein S18 acetylase RimI-like enzyme